MVDHMQFPFISMFNPIAGADTSSMHLDETKTILVKNFPATCGEKKLKIAFENISKGKVTYVKFGDDNQTAVIEFSNAYFVNVVLKKRPIKFMGKNLQVEIYTRYLETDEKLSTVKLIGMKPDIGEKLKTLHQDTEINPIDQVSIGERTINQQAILTQKLNEFCEELRQKVNETVIENQLQKEQITELSDDLTGARSLIKEQRNAITEMDAEIAAYRSQEIQITQELLEKSNTIQDLGYKISTLKDKVIRTRAENYSQSIQIAELMQECKYTRSEISEKGDIIKNLEYLLQESQSEQRKLRERISNLMEENHRWRIHIGELTQECEYTRKEIIETNRRWEQHLSRYKICYAVILVVIAMTALLAVYFFNHGILL